MTENHQPGIIPEAADLLQAVADAGGHATHAQIADALGERLRQVDLAALVQVGYLDRYRPAKLTHLRTGRGDDLYVITDSGRKWTRRTRPAAEEEDEGPDESALVDVVRGVLEEEYGAEEHPPFIGVVFTATEWDNGYYLDDAGKVYFEGLTDPDSVDFGEGAAELLSGWGKTGERGALAVRLSDGETEFDDAYGHTVYEWLGVMEG